MEKETKPEPPLELDPLTDSLQGEIVKAQDARSLDAVRERFRKMADELEESCHTVLRDAIAFRDIDPEKPEESPDWEGLGPIDRQKRLRIAKAAWMNKKDAPVGIALAAQIAVGMAKARAAEKVVEERTLNVQVVMMTTAMPVFDEIIVDRSEDK